MAWYPEWDLGTKWSKGCDIDDMALNIDIPSTILDFAGVEIPLSWQGKSLNCFRKQRSLCAGLQL